MKCKDMPKPEPRKMEAIVCHKCGKGIVVKIGPNQQTGATLVRVDALKPDAGYVCTKCMDKPQHAAIIASTRRSRRHPTP